MSNVLITKFGNEKRWITWKYEDIQGKHTKVPYSITGKKASTTNETMWSTYDEVVGMSQNIGIIFKPDKMLLGVDIGHILNGQVIIHEHKERIETFIKETNTYTEVSPSGTGLHLFLSLTEPLSLTANKKAPYEAYTSGRYFTFTGNCYGRAKEVRIVTPNEALKLLSIIGYPWKKDVKNETSKIDQSESSDEIRLQHMFLSKNGLKIKALHDGNISYYNNDNSSADMALCSHLAFWTNKNLGQMERLWINSPLGKREKVQNRKDYRDRTMAAAIENCKETYTSNKSTSSLENTNVEEDTTMAAKLADLVLEKSGVVLFRDGYGVACAQIKIKDHTEIWRCNSSHFKLWMSKKYRDTYGKIPNSNSTSAAMNIIEWKATFDSAEHRLHNRIAYHENSIWYDLANPDWSAVKISKEEVLIIKDVPILFKRYSHHSEQVKPISGGKVSDVLKYVNITEPDHQLLFIVHLVSFFIPDFPHPVWYIYGPQGSAKSTVSIVARSLVDPSKLGVVSMPRSIDDLVLQLSHHYFLFYDNVSYLSPEISDLICRAITGSGFSKRRLYTDNEDVILTLLSNIGINGINLGAVQPDLLERSLLLELDRIKDKDRKEANKLMEEFESEKPKILGAIFETVSKALTIKENLNISHLPRMADFTLWGCAIAEALGYNKDSFLRAYSKNIESQNDEALEGNIVATFVMFLMENKDVWKGTATQLLVEMQDFAYRKRINPRGLPNRPNTLARQINTLKQTLEKAGLRINHQRDGGQNRITIIEKVSSNTVSVVESSYGHMYTPEIQDDICSNINYNDKTDYDDIM